MALITLPSTLVPNGARPFLMDFGGVLTPFSGGPSQRFNRLGMRIGAQFTMPPLRSKDDGLVLMNRLMQAKADRLLINWPLLGFDPGAVGTPLVRVAVSGGTTLQGKGLPAAKVLKEGQPFSVISGGRRYFHFFNGATANGSGDVTVSVWPPIRAALAVNDVLEIAQPKLEGHVLPGDELNWEMTINRLFEGISFSVVEAA